MSKFLQTIKACISFTFYKDKFFSYILVLYALQLEVLYRRGIMCPVC